MEWTSGEEFAVDKYASANVGRASHVKRGRSLAKECVGSNRAREERLHHPVATTTEANPHSEYTKPRPCRLKTAGQETRPPNNKQRPRVDSNRTRPAKKKPLPLDKLFQERFRSVTVRNRCFRKCLPHKGLRLRLRKPMLSRASVTRPMVWNIARETTRPQCRNRQLGDRVATHVVV